MDTNFIFSALGFDVQAVISVLFARDETKDFEGIFCAHIRNVKVIVDVRTESCAIRVLITRTLCTAMEMGDHFTFHRSTGHS